MTDQHELMKIDDLKEAALQRASDDDFDALQAASAYLPRVQLMTSNSDKCKAGEFPVNNWALVRGQEYQDLGSEIDVLVCSWRPMALEIGDAVVTSYDRSSDTFQSIQERADESDSGCMWGYQFLLWVPSVGTFATFFCGSKSARREAPAVKARMDGPATLKSRKIEKGKYTWFAPTCHDCSTPFDMPPKADYLREMEKFNNPSEQQVELAQEEERPQ